MVDKWDPELPRLIVAVDATSPGQTLEQVQSVVVAGCGRVMLVLPDARGHQLAELVAAIAGQHPALWLGVNRLGRATDIGTGLPSGVAAVWTDDVAAASKRPPGHPEVFAGVGFVDPGRDTASLVEQAVDATHANRTWGEVSPIADVVVTRGPTDAAGRGTDHDYIRIDAIRTAVADTTPVAVAGGITGDTCPELLALADHLIVGKGVRQGARIDQKLVRRLIERISPFCEGDDVRAARRGHALYSRPHRADSRGFRNGHFHQRPMIDVSGRDREELLLALTILRTEKLTHLVETPRQLTLCDEHPVGGLPLPPNAIVRPVPVGSAPATVVDLVVEWLGTRAVYGHPELQEEYMGPGWRIFNEWSGQLAWGPFVRAAVQPQLVYISK